MSQLPRNENQGPAVLGVVWTLTGLAVIAVASRLYVRMVKSSTAGLDDLTIAVGVAILVFSSSCNNVLVHNGYGRHFEYLSLYQKSRLLQWTQAVEFANYIGLFFVRISIGFLLLRLLANTNHWTRWAVHFVLVVNTCAIIMVVVPYAIICIPFKAYYDKSVHGKCINPEVIRQVTRTYGGIGCFMDFTCATLPILILRRLQMNRGKRLVVACTLGLGYLTAACSIGRTITADVQTEDPSWDLMPVTYWANFEYAVGIIVACAPALRQLFVSLRNERTAGNTGNEASSGTPRYGRNYPSRILGDKIWGTQEHEATAGDAESQSGLVRDTNVPDGAVGRHTTIDVELEPMGRPCHREDNWSVLEAR